MNLLDNSGALRKFKLQNGLSRSEAPTSSAYILSSKIKKIIREIDDETLVGMKPERLSRIVFINRLVDRIEQLDAATLKYVLDVYDKSYSMFCNLVAKTKTQIIVEAKHYAAEKRKQEVKDERRAERDIYFGEVDPY